MIGNIVVGLIFALILFFAGRRAFSDMKQGKCTGCSSCSSKKTCNIDEVKQIKL
ncbi:MAG TPA: FeoB-associated Cys-rich membrane protein [Clostridiales bacterium UBA8960]|nr:FeoB-associated Cys-rich membrane protein [Clostridiales bacterium UBA8960]